MQFKTRQEIAQAYGIDRKTLYRKLKSRGITLSRGLITIQELEKIYTVLGRPNQVLSQQYNRFRDGNERRMVG